MGLSGNLAAAINEIALKSTKCPPNIQRPRRSRSSGVYLQCVERPKLLCSWFIITQSLICLKSLPNAQQDKTGSHYNLYVWIYYILCIYIYVNMCMYAYTHTYIYIYVFCNRRKFRSQTSDNMDRWKAEMGKRQREEQSRREKMIEEKESEERRCRCAKK